MYDEKTYEETYEEPYEAGERTAEEAYPETGYGEAAGGEGAAETAYADPAYDPLARHRHRHDFTFSTGQLSALVGGLAALGLLLFILGVAVGARLSPLPGAATIAETPPAASEPRAAAPPTASPAAPEARPLVLPPAPPRPPAATTPPAVAQADPAGAPAGVIYELQIAYYHNRQDAERGLEAFRGQGGEPYVVGARSPKLGLPRYTLRLGPFATMADALAAQRAYAASTGAASTIRYRAPAPDPPGDATAGLLPPSWTTGS